MTPISISSARLRQTTLIVQTHSLPTARTILLVQKNLALGPDSPPGADLAQFLPCPVATYGYVHDSRHTLASRISPRSVQTPHTNQPGSDPIRLSPPNARFKIQRSNGRNINVIVFAWLKVHVRIGTLKLKLAGWRPFPKAFIFCATICHRRKLEGTGLVFSSASNCFRDTGKFATCCHYSLLWDF